MTDNWDQLAADARAAERNVRVNKSAIRQTIGVGALGILAVVVGIIAPYTPLTLAAP